MPRPTKCRRVGFLPGKGFFKPAGIPMRELESVTLFIEELEAVRLKDREGLEQEDCASEMGISRPTFRRILISARSKIAEALLDGKGLKIEGGIFEVGPGRYRCGWDGHEWDLPNNEPADNDIRICPKCKRSNVPSIDASVQGPGKGRCGRGRGWRRWQSAEDAGVGNEQSSIGGEKCPD